MSDPKPPSLPKSLHPQTSGKNKFANPPKKEKTPAAVETSTVTSVSTPARAPVPSAPVAPSPAVVTPKSAPAPGKDLKRFEITVSLTGPSSEPPFTVDVPLTGNGPADQAAARALARKKFPGRAMTVISSRIFTRTENCLLEIAPGSTLSGLFGAPGGPTEDFIEVGRAFYDGSRGTLFLRNLRSHVGLTFRPATGGLAVFSNRIVSNRLASELPIIVAEILGNNAREIEIYLKP